MAFDNLADIEAALQGGRLPVRALHEIWEHRQPVPEPPTKKPAPGRIADGRQVPWIQADRVSAARFSKQALDAEEFLLVCDAAREILRHWEREGQDDSLELLRVRMHFAAALPRFNYPQAASRELHNCLRAEPGTRLKAEILQQLGEVQREEAHRASDRATALQAIEIALKFYRQARELQPDSAEACVWAAATMLYVAGEHSSRRTEGLDCARQALELATARADLEGSRFATVLARAEALALLGKEDEAAKAYEALGNVPDRSISALAAARYRTRFIADAIDKPRDFLRSAFPPLQLIVFSGHIPDLPDQPVRFPLSVVAQVRTELIARLQ